MANLRADMYATVDDMIKRFGESEMIALTDRLNDGEVDHELAASSLVDASSEIDGYLVAIKSSLKTVPPILTVYCCDIARYRLCGADVIETSVIAQRYAQAISYLEKVAAGKVSLIVPDDDDGASSSSGSSVLFSNSGKVFGRDQSY